MSAQQYAVIVGDVPIHYQPGEGAFDGADDLEVRGPFTRAEAEEYALRLARYVVLVVPFNAPSTPDEMLIEAQRV